MKTKNFNRISEFFAFMAIIGFIISVFGLYEFALKEIIKDNIIYGGFLFCFISFCFVGILNYVEDIGKKVKKNESKN